jgi:tryptophan 2,3-dioxygenase
MHPALPHPGARYPRQVSNDTASGGPPAPGDGTEPGVAGEWGGTEIQFGEQGARLTYGSYLRLDQLLSAQRLESQVQSGRPAHDELLFITIHQVYELWFQQLLHEATAARDAMLDTGQDPGSDGERGGLWWAQHLLQRMHVIERVLVQQIDVLETMTPQDFLQFRQALAPASGFQSVQFRELEFLSGAQDASFVRRFKGLTDAERDRLLRRLGEPTLWDAFVRVLGSRDLPVADDDQVTDSLRRVAHDRSTYADVWAVAEALLQHDELAAAWRARHVVMVERMIGTKQGTGGSSGADYLRSRLDLRYYPLLWELRSVL